jgi:thymidylate synthase
MVNQRSADAALGMPWNWTSYAVLLALIAKLTNHKPGEVIWNGGDVHIYHNHIEKMKKFLQLEESYEPPKLKIDEINSLEDIDHSTVELVDYESGPFIKLPVAV